MPVAAKLAPGAGANDVVKAADLTSLLDVVRVALPEEACSLRAIRDLVGIHTHHPRRHGIGRHRIVAEDEDTGRERIAVDGAVPLHTDDPVDDRVGGPDRSATSMIALSIPTQWSAFFGHPYTRPGKHPKQFFNDSVTPAQWCVFILGIETTMSASCKSVGIHNASSDE